MRHRALVPLALAVLAVPSHGGGPALAAPKPVATEGLSGAALHGLGVDCVEHVLGADTPALCARALAVMRAWLRDGSGQAEALAAVRGEVEAMFQQEKPLWRDYGVPAIALRATLAALAPDPQQAAAGASVEGQTLASQRGYARSKATSPRDRGEDADEAAGLEVQWQQARVAALRRSPAEAPAR